MHKYKIILPLIDKLQTWASSFHVRIALPHVMHSSENKYTTINIWTEIPVKVKRLLGSFL